MPDLVMAASAAALAHARADESDVVTPDHLLVGALEVAGRLGIAVFGPIILDLRELPGNGRPVDSPPPERRPSYAPETAAVFDRATRIARQDGEPRVRLVHILAAFRRDDSSVLERLMAEQGFDETEWRAALAEWDRGMSLGRARRPESHKVLSVDEAAETLGVHAQTIRGYIRTGKLPAYRIGGERVLRIYATDLYDLLEPVEPDSDGRDVEG